MNVQLSIKSLVSENLLHICLSDYLLYMSIRIRITAITTTVIVNFKLPHLYVICMYSKRIEN